MKDYTYEELNREEEWFDGLRKEISSKAEEASIHHFDDLADALKKLYLYTTDVRRRIVELRIKKYMQDDPAVIQFVANQVAWHR